MAEGYQNIDIKNNLIKYYTFPNRSSAPTSVSMPLFKANAGNWQTGLVLGNTYGGGNFASILNVGNTDGEISQTLLLGSKFCIFTKQNTSVTISIDTTLSTGINYLYILGIE